jgi:hypothetical protein
MMPQPSVSLFIDDCIENGKDATQGGARYNFTSPLLVLCPRNKLHNI